MDRPPSLIFLHFLLLLLAEGNGVTAPGFLLREADSDVPDQLESPTNNPGCCVRRPKSISLGFGTSGEEISVDVGSCHRRCGPLTNSQRAHLEALLKAEPDLDPIQLFRRWQGNDSCSACEAESVRVERRHTPSGLHEVQIAESCGCKEAPFDCHRDSRPARFFPGTPFERTVDTGQCRGPCSRTLCQPTRNTTISIPGPNGDVAIPVIESCGCTGSCYRVSWFEHVYDYDDDGGRSLKEIDVGRCMGSCRGGRSYKCVAWDKENPGKCVSGLYSRISTCAPSRFRVHSYTAEDGSAMEIVAVAQCSCH